MKVEIKEFEAVCNLEHGIRFQIILVKTRMPEKVANLKEAVHFFRKRQKKVAKTGRPYRAGEVGELMEIDFKNAIHTIRPDNLVQADAQIEDARRLI